MGQRVVSWHHATHNNDSDDFMSQPPLDPYVRLSPHTAHEEGR